MHASTLACLVALSTACGLDSICGPEFEGQGGSAGADDYLFEESDVATSLLQHSVLHTEGAKLMLATPDPESGIWEAEDLIGRTHGGLNDCLADEFLQLMDKRNYTSVLDLGAGSGAYSMYLKDHLIGNDVRCCDGNAAIVSTSGGLCTMCDLTIPQPTMLPAQLLFSLEVAEHIPKDKETVFLNNIQSKSKQLVVISWGIPGQFGNGHVNLRANEYAIQKMKEAGFAYCTAETQRIRDTLSTSGCHNKWNSKNFMSTLMVFNRKGAGHC